MGLIEHTPGCKAGDIDAECPCEQDAPAAPGSPTALTEQIVRLEAQLAGAVRDRDRWQDCARKLYAKWQAGERPPSESALGRIGFQMREPERGQ